MLYGRNYINVIVSKGLEESTTRPVWRYIKFQRPNNFGISPLIESGGVHTGSAIQADIPNPQFLSVLKKDEGTAMPKTQGKGFPSIGVLHADAVLVNTLMKL